LDNKAGQIVLTAFEARGGGLGRPALGVLIVSPSATIGMFATIFTGF